MKHPEIPSFTPRIADALLAAGEALAHEVRLEILHSPRPVFLYYIAQTFDTLAAVLTHGQPPYPATPGEQLCLHLTITRAEEHSRRPDFGPIREALLRDAAHEPLDRIGRTAGKPSAPFDFVALGDALTTNGMGAFFAPFEPDELVA
ncbi:hypothetical protein OG563_36925 [Nocardia vinacea]|uniref:Uncharacterized protein n=1 Tax=Nocardia vinacea TaxID=96468 RepID=A0ABZ1YS41_9NOCA|nr:hypothetical protein [Nocardia vinacea]